MAGENENTFADKEQPLVTRRQALKGILAVLGAGALASCAPKPALDKMTALPETEKIELKKVLTEPSYRFAVSSEELGVTDPKDSNVIYPRAIKEGGIMQVGGASVKITYEGGVFNEKTFLHYPQVGQKLEPGDIIPQVYSFTEGTDNVVHQIKVQRYARSIQGDEPKEITLRREAQYFAIPMVVDGTQNGIVDSGNTTFESIGEGRYLAFALLEVGSQKNTDGTWGAQMLGVTANTSSQGIFVTQDNYPDLSEYE